MARKQNQALTAAMVASVIIFVGAVIGFGVWYSAYSARQAKIANLVEEIESLDKEFRFPSLRNPNVGMPDRSYGHSVHSLMVQQRDMEISSAIRRDIWQQQRGELEEKIRRLGGTPPPRPEAPGRRTVTISS